MYMFVHVCKYIQSNSQYNKFESFQLKNKKNVTLFSVELLGRSGEKGLGVNRWEAKFYFVRKLASLFSRVGVTKVETLKRRFFF